MKAMSLAATDLPWICPSARSLAALSQLPCLEAWQAVRHDPGALLVLARTGLDPLEAIRLGSPLSLAAPLLDAAGLAPVDWLHPARAKILQTCILQARLAGKLAERLGQEAHRAWMCGLLAPLGAIALAAVGAESDDAAEMLGIARRLSRTWRLPPFLDALVGNLGLNSVVAERLGAEPKLFQLTQLAIRLIQKRGFDLGQAVGASQVELAQQLGLSAEEVETLADEVVAQPMPKAECEPTPAQLMSALVRSSFQERQGKQTQLVESLHQDLDRLHDALAAQVADAAQTLHDLKLSALSELAGGAGHEINNPLAVISGQAQYLIRQMQLADEQLLEDPSPTYYLESLRTKWHKALQTIQGQTQRIHLLLTDLMQFARPNKPNPHTLALGAVLRDAVEPLRFLAETKKITLDVAEPPATLGVRVDPGQMRTALGNVIRNALEAAPPEGWVGIGFETEADRVRIVVQDNGPGPAPALREHLFDPFFSGRAAGRGRGLGLSTAWRLAREQGGDVRFEPSPDGLTRFVLAIPAAVIAQETWPEPIRSIAVA